jgi:hypothetical protein
MALQVQRTVTCDRCGQPASQAFGEGGRGWYESFHCPSCGRAYEADGFTPAPEEFRRAMIAEEGEWALDVTAPPSLMLLKAMRQEFSLSLGEAQELKGRLPGELRRGTRYEMEKLVQSLERFAGRGTLLARRTAGPARRNGP